MDTTELKVLLEESGALLEGHFGLSSGKHSNRYVQCALLLQHPSRAGLVGAAIGELWRDEGVDVVLGPALGGVVVAHEVARFLGTRAVFAERKQGEMMLRRGFAIESGERVLLAEDVVTTYHPAQARAERIKVSNKQRRFVRVLAGTQPLDDLTSHFSITLADPGGRSHYRLTLRPDSGRRRAPPTLARCPSRSGR